MTRPAPVQAYAAVSRGAVDLRNIRQTPDSVRSGVLAEYPRKRGVSEEARQAIAFSDLTVQAVTILSTEQHEAMVHALSFAEVALQLPPSDPRRQLAISLIQTTLAALREEPDAQA